MEKALIYCNHTAAKNHPNGLRIIHIAKMLKTLGYEIYVYGMAADASINRIEENITCIDLSNLNGRGLKIHFKRMSDMFLKIKKTLDEHKDASLIISAISDRNPFIHKHIRKFARNNKKVFVETIVEWYNIHNYTYRYWNRFLVNEYMMRFDNCKSKNIIAISTFLKKYYENKGCNTIYIPTIIDNDEYLGLVHEPNKKITISYAGSPGRKDSILNAIFALDLLTDEERSKIEFNIFGVTEGKLKNLGLSAELINKLEGCLKIHGRIPYDEVKNYIAASDYTILLRRNIRTAKAGFSTKVGESMACSTPIIANYTGDLDKYIVDCQNGIICEDESSKSCAKAYRKVLELAPETYENMRKNARLASLEQFEYKNYIDKLKNFLDNAIV